MNCELQATKYAASLGFTMISMLLSGNKAGQAGGIHLNRLKKKNNISIIPAMFLLVG